MRDTQRARNCWTHFAFALSACDTCSAHASSFRKAGRVLVEAMGFCLGGLRCCTGGRRTCASIFIGTIPLFGLLDVGVNFSSHFLREATRINWRRVRRFGAASGPCVSTLQHEARRDCTLVDCHHSELHPPCRRRAMNADLYVVVAEVNFTSLLTGRTQCQFERPPKKVPL